MTLGEVDPWMLVGGGARRGFASLVGFIRYWATMRDTVGWLDGVVQNPSFLGYPRRAETTGL